MRFHAYAPALMKLAVLNPAGRDPEQHFPEGAGVPDDRVHAPVNYHAYAACTRGSFHREVATIPAEQRAVLLLLRRDLKPAMKALRELKARGKIVAISWKESGSHQVAEQLDEAKNLTCFRELCASADAALSSTPELVPLYSSSGARLAEFVPTPYPVDDERWDFSAPLAARSGVFIGTREWSVPTRNHARALLHACSLGVPVTVFNTDGREGRRKLDALGCPHLRVLEGRLPYSGYLREMARCRVVFQLDASAVPGQVAGDALLCRMPCIGGNSAVEQLAFSGADLATLHDDARWEKTVAMSQAEAGRTLGYTAVAARLAEFFRRLGA